MVVEARQEATRPEVVWVRVHQGSMAERMDSGWWIVVSKPVGSRRLRCASVRRQERERMVLVLGFRPVI